MLAVGEGVMIPGVHDSTIRHDIDPLSVSKGVARFPREDHDSKSATVLQFSQGTVELGSGMCVEPLRGLIEQEDGRPQREGTGESDAALRGTVELPWSRVLCNGQTYLGEQLLRRLSGFLARGMGVLEERQLDILEDTKTGQERRTLEDDTESCAHAADHGIGFPSRIEPFALDDDRAGAGLFERQQVAHDDRFSGMDGAENDTGAAAPCRERDVEDRRRVIGPGEAGDVQHHVRRVRQGRE